jgi:serine/threonine protein kinase
MAQRRLQELKLNTQAPVDYDHARRTPTFSIDDDTDTASEMEAVDEAEEVSTTSGVSFSASSQSNDVSQLRERLYQRGTSITFNSTVRLDDGEQHDMGSPLPKPPASKGKTGEDAKSQPLEIPIKNRPRRHSDAERGEYDPITGEPLDQNHREVRKYHKGEMRHPLLQSTVDELAAQSSRLTVVDGLPSLTSDLTASPISENIRTPLNGGVLASSPLTISTGRTDAGMPSRRSVSQRSFGSLGSVGRRHNIKSAGSSLSSPARSYLSLWHSGSVVREPEPDDEGQEFGDPTGPIYIIGRKIGFGGFSVVKEATTMDGDRSIVRAVKIVRKQIKDISDVENESIQQDFDREVDIWRCLRHKYILPLIAAYYSDFATLCITKLNKDGTLFDLVASHRRKYPKNEWGLPTHLAKRYIYQLGSAIRYLHEDAHVVHRDIKPENCLLDLSAPDADKVGGNILLCDFGMADWISNDTQQTSYIDGHNRSSAGDRDGGDGGDSNPDSGTGSPLSGSTGHVGPSQTSTAVQGSLQYAAPEMFIAGQPLYSSAADMWAYGCVMYTLLTCELPFKHEFQPRLVLMISRGSYDHQKLQNAPALLDGGPDALSLVEGCLTVDPEQRFGIAQALDCEWLEGCKALYEESDFA